jgi:uncharacterized protein Yka (UPF0111/DUF47 family)
MMIWTRLSQSGLPRLFAIQTLKDWEEQQDDSTRQVVRQLKDLEKRIKALQLLNSKQTTLDSYLV